MWDCCHNLAIAIPPITSSTPVDFPELAEVNIITEVLTHRARF
jgi:hypothetical protein